MGDTKSEGATRTTRAMVATRRTIEIVVTLTRAAYVATEWTNWLS